MKIAFLGRNSLFTDRGGDTIQLEKTLKYLQRYDDLKVTVFTEVTDLLAEKDVYDVLHIFGMLDVCEFMELTQESKNYNKVFLSTIYVDYYDFELHRANPFVKFIFSHMHSSTIEYIKNCVKMILKKKPFSLSYLFLGHKKSIQNLIKSVDVLLPNSNSEATRVFLDFSIGKKFRVIPNGIEPLRENVVVDNLKLNSNEITFFKDCILCVGRIEGRKGQLDLIRALKFSDKKLIIIGKPASNQPNYYKNCINEAGENTYFYDFMEQDKLFEIFKLAKVHVLPSWFETTGLVSLEAWYYGCNIVVSKNGDTEDYFSKNAIYCKPGCPESIKKAVSIAYNAKNHDMSGYVEENYSWEIAGNKTLLAYKDELFI